MKRPSSDPNAAIIPGPESKITVKVKLSINNSYGQSDLALVNEALVAHRYSMISVFFDELRAGEFENAYVYWKSAESINDLINHLLEKTALLAINNHYAEEYSSNPGGYSNWKERLPKDLAERYEMFLKMAKPDASDGSKGDEADD